MLDDGRVKENMHAVLKSAAINSCLNKLEQNTQRLHTYFDQPERKLSSASHNSNPDHLLRPNLQRPQVANSSTSSPATNNKYTYLLIVKNKCFPFPPLIVCYFIVAMLSLVLNYQKAIALSLVLNNDVVCCCADAIVLL